ncbi:ABC-2 type transport system permease protein [Anaerosporobacter mobilis DSM 15930]|jgi:ABC-2 type transport system permease protein|uniref:ABC-2 type transport system permease protein n=1 Tax=Anaerosporobacter mobilis DSM 15930 TaxID=1120996 RepID=A0A1M7H6P9_9FIRM|nr:ABC transporter permease [Anaerosporobacter mobilis]SHM23707.1 ABC-2 type transport system permease protein [Anaerosporobacter mobilis DSM 15930]
MLAIFKKELRSYFTSMIGYLFIGFFLAIVGVYFMAYNLQGGYANFEYVLNSMVFVFVILVPILTMRLLAEEKKQKTDQLLFTSPLSVSKIVVGKYLAVFAVFVSAMVITMFYPFILSKYGTVSFKLAYTGILGFVLVGAAYLAIGLFLSALFESQAIAAVVTFVVLLITFIMQGIVGLLPTSNKAAWLIFSVIALLIAVVIYFMINNVTVAISLGVVLEAACAIIYFAKPSLYDGLVVKVFDWFSVVDRFDNFMNGILDLSGIVYYISITVIFIFLTIQSLNKRRWR